MEREELYMFTKIKFQILTPYDEKMTMHNINVFKQMGVEVENIRQADILDQAGKQSFWSWYFDM